MERYFEKEIECASRDQITAWQSERLAATVKHTYDNVPMYRERMNEAGVAPEDIRTVEDITKLPFTMKKDLRDTYPFGMFAVPMADVVRLHASSGTTGKQIVVGYTKEDLEVWDTICARQLVAAGATKDDKIHVSYGYGLFTGGFGIHGGAGKIGAVAIPVSSGNTARQVTILQDFGSDILCCTPSYALYIAECVEQAGIDAKTLPLRAGIFGAEPWTEEMRHEIEKKLDIKAYDIYGLTEVMGPGVAYECSEQKGMHVNEDHFIIEVIDPDTEEHVPDGTPGEIVFTSLTKKAFPVIRYRTRDIGVITHEKCACGRSFVRMSKPMGRTDDMLIIRGVNVFPSQIETVLINTGYLPNYQIVVDRVNNLDTIEVLVEMSEDSFSDVLTELAAKERELSENIKSLLGVAAKVRLVSPKSIKRSEGKAIRVIDNRKLH
jgi:phenylacetate-CoA ligase